MDYKKQAQDYYSRSPLIVLGSGASVANGIPGMECLAKTLVKEINTKELSKDDLNCWNEFCKRLNDGISLEKALDIDSDVLVNKIIRKTWWVINNKDCLVFKESLQRKNMFALSRLLRHMFDSTTRIVNIVTTNYDRLAEYSCEKEKIHHYTGFSHGFFRQRVLPNEISSMRKVNIWKVHGSLDWFESNEFSDTFALSNIDSIPDNYQPQIVTPGNIKYQKTHSEPFRSIISGADNAISEARSYLCIGYGFNDVHIQQGVIRKCISDDTPITIITKTLTESARNIFLNKKNINSYLAIECNDHGSGSMVYSSYISDPIAVKDNVWDLDGYLSLIM